METIWQDFRYGFRMLVRRPLFAVLAILTLALGIGANTAIFSVIYAVLLNPLPYPDSQSLVLLHGVDRERPTMTLSFLDFNDLTQQSQAFESATAIRPETCNITGTGDPERVAAAGVTGPFFEVFRTPPVLGRGFRSEEEKMEAPRVAVISYGLWQRRFGGNPKVLGQTIQLSGQNHTIVGIAAAGFEFPSKVEIWRPLRLEAEELTPDQRGARYLRAIGRLKSGMTAQQAAMRVQQVGADLARKYPKSEGEAGASVTSLQDFMVRKVRKALWVLLGAVGFVLLIACANVANLFLVHATQRETEVAIRTALGAGRGRLVRQFVLEGILLTMVAGAFGILAALWLTQLLKSMGPENLPRLAEIGINTSVLIFTLAISIVAGLLVGLVPALQGMRKWGQSLKSAGQRATSGSRIRGLLVAGEIALALMLLAGAGLLIRSFARLQQVDPGFNSTGVYTCALSLPDARYGQPHQSASFFSELTHRLAQRPGVKSSAAIFGLPLSDGFNAGGSFTRTDKPVNPENEPEAGLRIVTPDYFQVMGIAVPHGRPFRESDSANATPVAILNEEAARRFWPGEDPIGKQLKMHISLVDVKNDPRTIVGIVRNVHFEGLDSDPEPEVFIPHAQHPIGIMTVVLRVDPSLTGIENLLRNEVKAMDPDLPIWDNQSMDQIVGASLAARKFTMLLLSSFAALAVLLAAVGIYGVLSYTVVQRTREIGLRMAVGACRSDVLGLFLKEGSRVLAVGMLTGLAGALAVTRILESLLFGIPPTDPLAFAAGAILLCAIAMSAGILPALRASRVDPMTALRYE